MFAPVLNRSLAVRGGIPPRGHVRRACPQTGRTREQARHAALARRGGTPAPDHQSQSLSRGYGSCLPTSLVHMPSWARGFSPWRPDADMSTTGGVRFAPPDFQGPSEARRTRATSGGAIPIAEPYLPSNGFQGTGSVKEKRELFPPPPPASPGSIASPPTPAPSEGISTFSPFGALGCAP